MSVTRSNYFIATLTLYNMQTKAKLGHTKIEILLFYL